MDHHPFHCYDQCGATNNDGNNDHYEGDSKEATADDNSSGDYDDASRPCIFFQTFALDNCSAFSAVRVSSNFAALSNVQCPLQKAQFQIRFEKSRCCNIAVDCKCELGRTSFCAFVAVLTSDLALQIGCANT